MNDLLLMLLQKGLQGDPEPVWTAQEEKAAKDCDWDALVEAAEKHSVLSLFYDPLRTLPAPEDVLKKSERYAAGIARQNYILWILTGQLLAKMRERGLPVIVLKGLGTASYYPVPELRKSGDIDLLLLEPERLAEAEEALAEFGCVVKERQAVLHHVVYDVLWGGRMRVELELHTMLAEPFDDAKVNERLQSQMADCAAHTVGVAVAGIPVTMLDAAYHAYELLLHMLQHFLRSGFGLKLLCDWAVFWRQDMAESEKALYLELVESCGVKKFSDLVTLTCIRYLGLSEEKTAFMGLDKSLNPEVFLQEILEAEEFGKSSKDRMVALRGNGLADYVREFHHQMHLNYPRAGKCVLLWLVLWTLTLVRFLVNNRRIRRTSLGAILKKAGQRGELIKKLDLFHTGN